MQLSFFYIPLYERWQSDTCSELHCSLCHPLQERASILVWLGWLDAVGLRINSPSWWPSSKPPRCTCEVSAQHQGGANNVTLTVPKGQRARRRSEWPTLQVNTGSLCYTDSTDLCCCVVCTVRNSQNGTQMIGSLYIFIHTHTQVQIYNNNTKACHWSWWDSCKLKHVIHIKGLCFGGVRWLCLCEALKH